MAAIRRSVLVHFEGSTRFISKTTHVFFGRASSTTTNNFRYCQLDKRGLLRVTGKDSVKLLQGIVTNNIELFHEDTSMKTMYCMVLNAQGRVLYDCMLYKYQKTPENPSFFIECDKSAMNSFTKLLKMYKLRSKVDISAVGDVIPWVIFSNDQSEPPMPDIKANNLISMGRDPRVSNLGWRLLLSQSANPAEIIQGVTEGREGAYEIHRIQLGVSEGTDEIKPGVALPLEYNLDYIHGVSFQKGCYIGQELTARTYHTGVIRKRILPFTFNSPESIIKLEHGATIKTSTGKTSGKLCVIYGQYGLAVMRMAMISKDKQFIQDNEGKDVQVCPYIPKWWPKDQE